MNVGDTVIYRSQGGGYEPATVCQIKGDTALITPHNWLGAWRGWDVPITSLYARPSPRDTKPRNHAA